MAGGDCGQARHGEIAHYRGELVEVCGATAAMTKKVSPATTKARQKTAMDTVSMNWLVRQAHGGDSLGVMLIVRRQGVVRGV